MHHFPRRNFALRRTEHYKKPKPPAKFAVSGSPICDILTSLVLEEALRLPRSGIKHLEEIKSSGYEMPSVNQIEVLIHIHCFAAADLDRPPVPRRFIRFANNVPSSHTVKNIPLSSRHIAPLLEAEWIMTSFKNAQERCHNITDQVSSSSQSDRQPAWPRPCADSAPLVVAKRVRLRLGHVGIRIRALVLSDLSLFPSPRRHHASGPIVRCTTFPSMTRTSKILMGWTKGRTAQ